MGLDEYRETLIERLRTCQDTAAARSLLADANLFLTNSRINQLTKDRFWETLEEELDALGEDAKFVADRKAAAILGTVGAAARVRIARYHRRDVSDASATGC